MYLTMYILPPQAILCYYNTLIIQECLCIYILKCSWAGLVCLQITLPPATGLVVTYEVKEIEAQFTRSEVCCGQILDHECIE